MVSHDRSRGEQSHHARQKETKFKHLARRSRLLGQWAAGLLGSSRDAAEAYARAGDANVIRNLRGDFDRARVLVSDDDISAKLAEFTLEARQD